MTFSVVIPTYNRLDLLRQCLNCLDYTNQNQASDAYEIIVTDDSSNDDTKNHLIEFYPTIKYIRGPKKGPASNRNNGAKAAIGEWIIFIDDDCLPGACLIEQYQEAIKNNQLVEVFEGSIIADRDQASFIEESPINETGGYLWSCNFMIKKRLFLEMLGFDEGFPFAAMEDVDFHYRLVKAGKTVQFVKNAGVIHPCRVQTRTYDVTMKRFKSLQYFLKKHPEKAKEFKMVYFLRLVYAYLRSLFANSFEYRFRGFGNQLVLISLHFYFGIYFSIKS